MCEVEKALEKYKEGKHIHIGHPLDYQKNPEDLSKCSHTNLAIIHAIYDYEISKGGIKIVDGLMVIDSDVQKKLPTVRSNETLWCCIEDEKPCDG